MKKFNWEQFFLIVLIVISPFLVFYNLELNPRPWHDEGSYLTLAKTLVEDGTYAVRNSDGYQTFGAVQSLGPTVILPIAWIFRMFGSGLLQGRIISGIYLLCTLMLFYLTAHLLFGRKSALFSVVLLLASPAVGFLMYGRPVLGEGSALGFFLASWVVWSTGVRKQKNWLYILSGLLLGATIVTKSQYLLIGFASVGIMILLDLVHYRLGGYKGLLVVGFVAAGCVAAWYGWQVHYYGAQLFRENSSKLGSLAGVTMGLNLRSSINALRFLFGSGSGYTYIFWGFPALIYSFILASRRQRESFTLAYLVIFVSLWLSYFVFVIIPWSRYIFPAAAILAIFVGKLFVDLLDGFVLSAHEIWPEIKGFILSGSSLSSKGFMGLGTFLALITLMLWSGYQLQKVIREDVLDKYGIENTEIYSPPQFALPEEMAKYLTDSIPQDAVIDTWERELGILTKNRYHYPDASFLASAHKIVYRDGTGSQSLAILGKDYFNSVHPDYVLVGWYARFNHLYDTEYLIQNAKLIKTIGVGVWSYDLYKMNTP